VIKSLFGLTAAAVVSTGLVGCAPSRPQAAAVPPAPAPAAPPQPAAPPPPAPTPQAMSPRQRVEAVQTALNSHGAHLAVDGHLGPKTRGALRTYQRHHNLHVTGHPDSETLSSLGIKG